MGLPPSLPHMKGVRVGLNLSSSCTLWPWANKDASSRLGRVCVCVCVQQPPQTNFHSTPPVGTQMSQKPLVGHCESQEAELGRLWPDPAGLFSHSDQVVPPHPPPRNGNLQQYLHRPATELEAPKCTLISSLLRLFPFRSGPVCWIADLLHVVGCLLQKCKPSCTHKQKKRRPGNITTIANVEMMAKGPKTCSHADFFIMQGKGEVH